MFKLLRAPVCYNPPMHPYRTHSCAELRTRHKGEKARLSGWVHRTRDHGGLIFIDLRDHYGITQCVAHPGTPAFDAAAKLRPESVVRIEGEVVKRDKDTINPEIATGKVELLIQAIAILSSAEELPLPVFGEPGLSRRAAPRIPLSGSAPRGHA